MGTLIATVGLPGSGKTTRARAWVAAGPHHRARVNRDDIRRMCHGGRLGTDAQEAQVTAAQHAAVTALLAAGVDVVVDDTNTRPEFRDALRRLAMVAGAEFVVWDLTGVPVEECIRRDAQREGSARVGEGVIRMMAAEVEWHRREPSG